MSHSVRLPHPVHGWVTEASCNAGDWTTTYGWGGHDAATERAEQHVGDATQTHTVRADEMSGERLVMPGLSR